MKVAAVRDSRHQVTTTAARTLLTQFQISASVLCIILCCLEISSHFSFVNHCFRVGSSKKDKVSIVLAVSELDFQLGVVWLRLCPSWAELCTADVGYLLQCRLAVCLETIHWTGDPVIDLNSGLRCEQWVNLTLVLIMHYFKKQYWSMDVRGRQQLEDFKPKLDTCDATQFKNWGDSNPWSSLYNCLLFPHWGHLYIGEGVMMALRLP